jgi:hypothetical protein
VHTTIWSAAGLESSEHAVNAKVLVALLRRVLPTPWQFELEAHPAVEMTLFHQPEQSRLLAGLLNMQTITPPLPVGAKVRVKLPPGRRVSSVVLLPDRKQLKFEMAGPYVQFSLDPFAILAMALVQYA